jgi:hypothetical protein
MFRRVVAVGFTVALALTSTAFAQTTPRGDAPDQRITVGRPWQFWLKGNGQKYDNFFQVAEGRPQDDVNAIMGEVGASLRLGRSPVALYGSFNHLNYRDFGLDASNGVRVGLRSNARPHSFDFYAEQLMDRPTFDVGDEFDTADIRTLAGEYAFRFAGDWQVSADAELQQQEYNLTPSRDNDFNAFGGAVRWRGSRLFSPEIGVRVGERDVDDPSFSYDQRDLYAQVRSSITPELYLSLRYRDRSRDYSTSNVAASNFGREDERRQLAATADWTFMPSLTLNLYAARENVDVNLPNRDFDTALYLVGLTWRY